MPSTNPSHSPHTPLKSEPTSDRLHNFRDLGGLPTHGGLSVLPGKLFRSATVCFLTPAVVDGLADRTQIRTRLDLRSHAEASANPGEWHRAETRTHYLPFAAVTPPEEAATSRANHVAIAASYLDYLRSSGRSIVRGMNLIAEPSAPGVLIHCAGGKDRTGVMVACLLDILDVTAPAIAEDYAATSLELDSTRQELADHGLFNQQTAEIAQVWGSAEPEIMDEFMRLLHDTYGGAIGALAEAGLTDTTVSALREQYLTDARAL